MREAAGRARVRLAVVRVGEDVPVPDRRDDRDGEQQRVRERPAAARS